MLVQLPAAQADEAKAASVKIHQTGNTCSAVMTLPVSQSHALTVFTNYVSTGKAMPDISRVQILSRQGNLIRIRQIHQVPDTFGLTVSALLAAEKNQNGNQISHA